MKELLSKNFGVVCISVSIVLAAILFAIATRHESFIVQKRYGHEWHILDHWTGKVQ